MQFETKHFIAANFAIFCLARAIAVLFYADRGSLHHYMFCIKCGTENSDSAVYCQKCGSTLAAEEETRVATRTYGSNIGDEESIIFTISPTLMFVKIGYAVAVAGAFLLVALLSVFMPGISYVIAIPLAMALLLIPAYFHFRRKMIRYTLTDSKIEIDEGFISRTTRNVPLRRIQDVTVSSGITQRMLGFGDLVIDNAGTDGDRITLKNVNSPRKYADILLKQMRQIER